MGGGGGGRNNNNNNKRFKIYFEFQVVNYDVFLYACSAADYISVPTERWALPLSAFRSNRSQKQ